MFDLSGKIALITGSSRGLGLSIVNRLISVEHNGKVDVESTEGEGATFTISLPLVESVV